MGANVSNGPAPLRDAIVPLSVPMQRGEAHFVPRVWQASSTAGMLATAGPTAHSSYDTAAFPFGPAPPASYICLEPPADSGKDSTMADAPEAPVASNEARPLKNFPPSIGGIIHEVSHPATPSTSPISSSDGKSAVAGFDKATWSESQDEHADTQRRKNPFSPSRTGRPTPFPIPNLRDHNK